MLCTRAGSHVAFPGLVRLSANMRSGSTSFGIAEKETLLDPWTPRSLVQAPAVLPDESTRTDQAGHESRLNSGLLVLHFDGVS